MWPVSRMEEQPVVFHNPAWMDGNNMTTMGSVAGIQSSRNIFQMQASSMDQTDPYAHMMNSIY